MKKPRKLVYTWPQYWCPPAEKAPNESIEFVSYQKSFSASQNKELFEKYGLDGPRNWFDSNQYVKKLKKTVCTCINKIFLDIYLLLITIMPSKKYKWKNIVSNKENAIFHWLYVIKDLFKKIFHETRKTVSNETFFEKLEQNGFR